MARCTLVVMMLTLQCYWEQPSYSNKTAKKLKGTVKLIFQPAEEGRAGAYHMIKEGTLDKVQAIFGLHVEPEVTTGKIESRPGTILAGSARFIATVTSQSQACDPVLVTSMMIMVLQQLISRETDPLGSRVVTVGFVRASETQEHVELGGTCRSTTSEGLFELMQRIKQVIEMQAEVQRCTSSIDFMEEERRPYSATVNDEGMYDYVKGIGEILLGGPENVGMAPVLMAAEDFAFYSQRIPAAFFFIGIGNDTLGSYKPLHSPHFFVDEEVLPVGAALHAAVAFSYLLTKPQNHSHGASGVFACAVTDFESTGTGWDCGGGPIRR